MAEKIVDLTTYNQSRVDDETDNGKKRKSKKFFYLLAIILILLAYLGLSVLAKYKDCDELAVYVRNDSAETHYEIFGDNILKISTDGVFNTTADGEIVYNYTFDMVSPRVRVGTGYAVIYDFMGKDIVIISKDGFAGSIKTTYPIVEADVGAKGTVCVLMQTSDVSYIQIMDVKGTVLSAGQVFPQNSGIPMSIALSDDAKKMLVSMINLSSGNIKTTLYFYNFGEEGKENVDNIVATHSYNDLIIPRVDYIAGDRAVAFGESEIILFNNDVNCTVSKEILSSAQINSVFYGGKYYGFIREKVSADGEIVNELSLYNTSGVECFIKEFTDAYEKVSVFDNGEVLLLNGRNVIIYNRFGIRRFEYTFDTNVYKVVQRNVPKKYVVIGETENKEIRIKWDR